MTVDSSFIGVPGQLDRLDSTTVTTAEGAVEREGIFVGDPELGDVRQRVREVTPAWNDGAAIVQIAEKGDSPTLQMLGEILDELREITLVLREGLNVR